MPQVDLLISNRVPEDQLEGVTLLIVLFFEIPSLHLDEGLDAFVELARKEGAYLINLLDKETNPHAHLFLRVFENVLLFLSNSFCPSW